jgi:hypothetical protein
MEFNLTEELSLVTQYSSNLSEYPLQGQQQLVDQQEQTINLNRK